MKTTDELREGFLSFFEERGHTRFPVVVADPARGRSLDALHLGRDAAAEAVLLGREGAARAALHHRAEGAARRREGHRPRPGRPHRAPRVDVRDARQLLVRRLLQGRRDRPRVGVRHRADGARPRPAVGDACSPATRSSGSGEDEVAVQGWLRKGLPRERIVPFPRSDNFWGPAGETGPCGPCSELHLDRGEEHGCGLETCGPNCENCDRYIEFWNLVFMEFDRHADGTLTPLPKQNIDTGMGLERGAMLLQGAESIFDTDGFRLIMDWIARESGVGYHDSPGGDEGAPRHLRPRARDDVPRRRGRDAVERGPGLRAAPPDPARGRAGAADRARGRLPRHRDRRRPGRAVVPGGRRAPRDRRAGRPRRGGAVPRDARARAEGVRGARRQGGDHRRGGVHARGDARVPDRAHGRARGGARPGGRRRRLPRGDGAAPRDLARGRRHERRAGRRVQPHDRLPHGVRRLREDRRADADRRARRRRGGALPREAARVAVLPGRAAAR